VLAEPVLAAVLLISHLQERQYQKADQLINLVLRVEIKPIALVQEVGLLISHQANQLISQGLLLLQTEVIRQVDPIVLIEVIRQVDLLATEVLHRADLPAVTEVIRQADLVPVVPGVLLLEEKINSEKVIDIIIV
jgi:hypothetical protein